jgi:Domain of unknown function (DUF4129)
MVKALSFGLSVLLVLALVSESSLASAPSSEIDSSKAVGSAMGKGSFPWYDSTKDQAEPIALPWEWKTSKSPPRNLSWLSLVGNLAALVGFGLALAVLVGVMVWFWRIYSPIDSQEKSRSLNAKGEPSRIESLPEGMRREFESTDPWSEALRRRDRGDLAGAVVCLFAHQLLTLSHLGLVRLAPGRTGRQLLRSVADADFRALVNPTLRLFEVVYYGHRIPSPEEFSSLWAQAEAFERRVAGGGVA